MARSARAMASGRSSAAPGRPAISRSRLRAGRSWCRYHRSTWVAVRTPSPDWRSCRETIPTRVSPTNTAAPDMPSHGDRSGSGSRSGGSTRISMVPSRLCDIGEMSPKRWHESRYCVRLLSRPMGRSVRSLNRGNPMVLHRISASISAIRANLMLVTDSVSDRALMVRMAASISSSVHATVACLVHSPSRLASPFRSASNRTVTVVAASTT
jgi:hypothetical protein